MFYDVCLDTFRAYFISMVKNRMQNRTDKRFRILRVANNVMFLLRRVFLLFLFVKSLPTGNTASDHQLTVSGKYIFSTVRSERFFFFFFKYTS